MKMQTNIFYTAALVMLGYLASAQTVPDQNPRFAESRDKYMTKQDSLLKNQGTTVQNTYQAYDWSQMREDHQYYRRDRRNDRRMARAQAPRFIYQNPWMGPWNAGYGWGGPHVCYRSGNWRFWW